MNARNSRPRVVSSAEGSEGFGCLWFGAAFMEGVRVFRRVLEGCGVPGL